jgi:hypothetical protein
MPLFLDIYFKYRYNMEVDEEQIYIQLFAWGFACGLSDGCGLEAWMRWSCIVEIVIGFKSAEEYYPSPPLGVDCADTSQLLKEKNFHGQFQYFQITQPCSSTVTPLYQ